jgi:hypothetical protein
MRIALLLLALTLACPALAAPKRVLFDNTHRQTAGNADWQIDTDQPLPDPDQDSVSAATPRTYWLGAVSSWAIDLVKRGYRVATLTPEFGITYGKAENPHDLSKYDAFVVIEPNTRFTPAESTAIFAYVREGGGLVAVGNHFGSDRDNDGIDAPRVWNALDSRQLWGVSFDVSGTDASNFSSVFSTNANPAADDPIVRGPYGVGDGLEFHNGSSLILHPTRNRSVRGTIWRGGVPRDTVGLMAARSTYGKGRIFFMGDSSPADDGSAAPGNRSIFDGWAEAGGRDSVVLLNATAWVARHGAPAAAPRGKAATRPSGTPRRR